jgi:hypothetical protein
VTAGTPESEPQVPEARPQHAFSKRPRPPPVDVRSGVPSASAGSATHAAGTRSLKRKLSRGPGAAAAAAQRSLSTPGGKRVRVDRNEDSEGDPFGSDDEEFMEAATAAKPPPVGGAWERAAGGAEPQNYPSTLSAEDGARILDRIRALEEKARDIVGEISALKTYFLH